MVNVVGSFWDASPGTIPNLYAYCGVAMISRSVSVREDQRVHTKEHVAEEQEVTETTQRESV